MRSIGEASDCEEMDQLCSDLSCSHSDGGRDICAEAPRLATCAISNQHRAARTWGQPLHYDDHLREAPEEYLRVGFRGRAEVLPVLYDLNPFCLHPTFLQYALHLDL